MPLRHGECVGKRLRQQRIRMAMDVAAGIGMEMDETAPVVKTVFET